MLKNLSNMRVAPSKVRPMTTLVYIHFVSGTRANMTLIVCHKSARKKGQRTWHLISKRKGDKTPQKVYHSASTFFGGGSKNGELRTN